MWINEIKNAPILYDYYSFKLKYYLTKGNYSKDNSINFHPDVSEYIIEEINNLTKKLNKFISIRLEHVKGDYYHNSLGNCYMLSSLINFSTDDWILHQGRLDYNGRPFRHSWIEKDGVVYDPAFNLVTIEELYDSFFITNYQYENEEARYLFERTDVFAFYEEDIKDTKLKNKYEFDTLETKIKAMIFLEDLDDFLEENKIKSYKR